MDITDDIGRLLLENKNNQNTMNQVSATDVTLMSLAMSDFALVTTHLLAHDYPVAGGLFVIGIVFVYLYHKFGSQ